MGERVVPLREVLVLRQSDFGWHCERAGRPIFVARGHVARGTAMPSMGTRGTVQVREFAIPDLFPTGMPRGL